MTEANEARVKELAALPFSMWKKITAEMGWTYRRLRLGVDHGVPECAASIFKTLPAEHTWAEIRKQVNALRLKLKREAANAQRKVRADRRRSYMRNYMKDYRAGVRKKERQATD